MIAVDEAPLCSSGRRVVFFGYPPKEFLGAWGVFLHLDDKIPMGKGAFIPGSVILDKFPSRLRMLLSEVVQNCRHADTSGVCWLLNLTLGYHCWPSELFPSSNLSQTARVGDDRQVDIYAIPVNHHLAVLNSGYVQEGHIVCDGMSFTREILSPIKGDPSFLKYSAPIFSFCGRYS